MDDEQQPECPECATIPWEREDEAHKLKGLCILCGRMYAMAETAGGCHTLERPGIKLSPAVAAAYRLNDMQGVMDLLGSGERRRRWVARCHLWDFHMLGDWQDAFASCGLAEPCVGDDKVKPLLRRRDEQIRITDVSLVLGADTGRRDTRDWVGIFQLDDGCFASVEAGCDSTGWDCRSWGTCTVSTDLKHLAQYGTTEEMRERLKVDVSRLGRGGAAVAWSRRVWLIDQGTNCLE